MLLGAPVSDDGSWGDVYWRALVKASPDILLVIDTAGRILFTNRVVPTGDILGHHIWEYADTDAETRLKAKIREVTETKKAVVYENEGRRVDGTPGAMYEVRAVPVLIDGKVERILWASSDISERKRLEQQLMKAQKMEALGLFASGVAHDFNNILAVILASSDFAARKHPAVATLAPMFHEISEAVPRGRELTRRLLAFSRAQTIRPVPFELGGMLTSFTGLIRRIVGTDVELVVRAPGTPVTVCADPTELEQVLMNLCANGRQAMPHGGVLEISLGVTQVDAAFVARNPWAREGSFAEISVRDTGEGMDPATLARAFEPFFTTKAEGTGLGLATVERIVQQHGGVVHVETAVGSGTTFRIHLPTYVRA